LTLPARGSLASFRLKVRFLGKPAHAASAPHEGLNALDAMIQCFVAIGLLRQQLREDARIHGIITYGGAAANIIPDRTEAHFSVRATDRTYAEAALGRVIDCARGAALTTGTTLEHEAVAGYETIRPNRPLAAAFARHLESLGWPLDPLPERPRMGSTDMGNVSRALPAIHSYVSIGPRELKGHTVEFREAAASEAGREGMLVAAKALALTALEVLSDPAFLAEVRRDFAEGRNAANAAS
jgi:metal-dependent amidase/aminoacylase/carboxypeptidase family protein